jgi:Alpha-2,8-polysialyltransferase (POLYST)
VESIQVNPAQALCRIFGDARIDVYADGLMSYGPTRTTLPGMVAGRIERLLHLDLVPGVTPLLLSEQHVHTDPISSESFRAIVKTMVANQVGIARDERLALIVGQHLAAGGLLSEREERDLYAAMVSGCVEAGHRSIAFKPHPSAPAGQLAGLRDVAQDRGVRFAVADERELAEAWYERRTVDLVVGCFSTALMTASSIYGLPVARLGTELMLERLTPFQNSNRIPVTLVDALVPDLSSLTRRENAPVLIAETDANALVIAVGYVMQPDRLTARRSEVVSFLRAHYESQSRYFKRRRLTRLGLPGSLPAPPPPPRKSTLRRRIGQLARRARQRLGRWLLGAEQSAHASHEQPHGSFTRCSLS